MWKDRACQHKNTKMEECDSFLWDLECCAHQITECPISILGTCKEHYGIQDTLAFILICLPTNTEKELVFNWRVSEMGSGKLSLLGFSFFVQWTVRQAQRDRREDQKESCLLVYCPKTHSGSIGLDKERLTRLGREWTSSSIQGNPVLSGDRVSVGFSHHSGLPGVC